MADPRSSEQIRQRNRKLAAARLVVAGAVIAVSLTLVLWDLYGSRPNPHSVPPPGVDLCRNGAIGKRP